MTKLPKHPIPPTKGKRYQYRTEWQRTSWQDPKAKSFQHLVYAERFARFLIEHQWQYGKLKTVRIDRREIHPWEPFREFDPEAFRGYWSDEALRANGFRERQS